MLYRIPLLRLNLGNMDNFQKQFGQLRSAVESQDVTAIVDSISALKHIDNLRFEREVSAYIGQRASGKLMPSLYTQRRLRALELALFGIFEDTKRFEQCLESTYPYVYEHFERTEAPIEHSKFEDLVSELHKLGTDGSSSGEFAAFIKNEPSVSALLRFSSQGLHQDLGDVFWSVATDLKQRLEQHQNKP